MRFPTKFRVWIDETKEFGLPLVRHGRFGREVHAGNGRELSACTEIPDKNGRLIWTGDVLRHFAETEDFRVDVCEENPLTWVPTVWANYVVIGNKWEGVK